MGMLKEQGFEIVPDIVDSATLSSLVHILTGSSIQRSRAGMRNALQLEAVRSLALDPSVCDFAKRALGDTAAPFRATLFDKSIQSNWLVVWHQDTALPLVKRIDAPGWGPWSVKEGMICAHAPASALEQILAIRVHLDDSTSENGPLRVLPKTHTGGVLTDDAIHDLSQAINPVECLASAGAILLMKPLLVHASSKAASASRRRVLHIEYAGHKHFPEGLELPA